MVSKKVIIGAVVIVVIIAIAAIAMAGGSSDKAADARYNYNAELVDSFKTNVSSGTTQTAPEGSQYLIVHVTVYNDSWGNGISTNDLIWKWTATTSAGVSYTPTVVGYLHPEYQLVTIEKGGHGSSVFVFEVPSTLSMSDLTISQSYDEMGKDPKMKRDESIKA